jgi:hypothetical protein
LKDAVLVSGRRREAAVLLEPHYRFLSVLKVIRRGVNSCVVTNNPEIQQVLSSFLRERFMVGFKARVPANVLPTTNPTAGFPAPNSDIFQGAFLCSVAVVLFFFFF